MSKLPIPKKVLLVDDSFFMKNILSNIMETSGHKVCGQASNGLEAFNRYKELNPDIVFMDITMPIVNGIEGLKMIMSYDKNAKVVMCSSMGQKPFLLEAIENGAKDFIVKPFTQAQIVEAIKKNA